MDYAGTAIWQDVATPCVSLPEYGGQVPAIPASAIGDDELERAFLWGSLQAAWGRCGFHLRTDGTLEAMGDR